MPIRNASQRIGKIGERSVEALIDDHPSWVARRQDADFGIDLEAELAETLPDGQILSGRLLKIQVKSGVKPTANGGHVTVTVDRVWLHYACQFHIPVVLIGVTRDGTQAWWCWVQEWALLNARHIRDTRSKTLTLRIPIEKTLLCGLDRDLVDISIGRHPAAMVLALRGVLSVSGGWENASIAEGIVELLGRTDYPSRDWTVRMIADKLISAGPNIAYWQAQQQLPILIALVRTAGDALSQDDIVHLVQRGEVYSRVGINALSVLYDEWPEHAASLDLPSAFTKAKIEPAAWYAKMRERFPGHRNFGMFLLDMPDCDLEYEGATLRINQEFREHVMAKWPNRADSVLLDCLFWPKQNSQA